MITLLWKDLMEFVRDRKTVLGTLLFVLILPVAGLIFKYISYSYQVKVALINNDEGIYGKMFEGTLEKTLAKSQRNIVFKKYISLHEVLKSKDISIILFLPKNFSKCIMSMGRTAKIMLYVNVEKPETILVRDIIDKALNNFSKNISQEILSKNLSPEIAESILDPIYVETIGLETDKRNIEALLNVFFFLIPFILTIYLSMFFSISFVCDSIVGERERKTIECLLVKPISGKEIVLSKILFTIILGMLISIGFAFGEYFYITSMAGLKSFNRGSIKPTLDFIGLFLITIFLTTLVTASISILLSLKAKSVRGAQSLSSSIAMILSFTIMLSIFIDLEKNPCSFFFYIIPYTHAVLALKKYYLYRNISLVISHLAYMVTFSLILIFLAIKICSDEENFIR